MCLPSNLTGNPLGFGCWPSFWWGRKLLPGSQGVGLVSGVQVAGLASDGMEGFFEKCEYRYGNEERGAVRLCLPSTGGGRHYLGFRMLAWPLGVGKCLPAVWAEIR